VLRYCACGWHGATSRLGSKLLLAQSIPPYSSPLRKNRKATRRWHFYLFPGGDGEIRLGPAGRPSQVRASSSSPRGRLAAKQIKKPPGGGFFICFWRRRWDSNPRYRYKPYASLAGMCLRPLGHVSFPIQQNFASQKTAMVLVADPFGQWNSPSFFEKVMLFPNRRLCAARVLPVPCTFRQSVPKS
jgi:hypothetical protein